MSLNEERLLALLREIAEYLPDGMYRLYRQDGVIKIKHRLIKSPAVKSYYSLAVQSGRFQGDYSANTLKDLVNVIDPTTKKKHKKPLRNFMPR